jgi:hypothetical protein
MAPLADGVSKEVFAAVSAGFSEKGWTPPARKKAAVAAAS